MDEIARLTPTFAGVSFAKLDELGSVQWPCNDAQSRSARRSCTSATFARGKGKFMLTEYVPTDERTGPRYPLHADHGPHPVAVQRRRADAAHRERRVARGGPARDQPARCRAARHQGRRLGARSQPRRRDGAARADHRPRGAGRGLHDVPPPADAGQRHHHRLLRLGDQLPRVQGDGGAGDALQRSDAATRRSTRRSPTRAGASRLPRRRSSFDDRRLPYARAARSRVGEAPASRTRAGSSPRRCRSRSSTTARRMPS